jgi:hypothetical protein
MAVDGTESRYGLFFLWPLVAFLQNFLELTKEVFVASLSRYFFNGRDKCLAVCNLDRDRAIAIALRPDTSGEFRRDHVSSRDFHGEGF